MAKADQNSLGHFLRHHGGQEAIVMEDTPGRLAETSGGVGHIVC
jgi:hypothetical protein